MPHHARLLPPRAPNAGIVLLWRSLARLMTEWWFLLLHTINVTIAGSAAIGLVLLYHTLYVSSAACAHARTRTRKCVFTPERTCTQAASHVTDGPLLLSILVLQHTAAVLVRTAHGAPCSAAAHAAPNAPPPRPLQTAAVFSASMHLLPRINFHGLMRVSAFISALLALLALPCVVLIMQRLGSATVRRYVSDNWPRIVQMLPAELSDAGADTYADQAAAHLQVRLSVCA